MPFSVRLDPETEARIRRVASSTGRSKSVVVREAVAQYTAEAERLKAAPTALDRLRAYVGILTTGGAQYSQDTHEKYRDAIVQKHHARRSRRRQRPHRPSR